MLGLNRRVRVFIWPEPTDMRKSFWSLSSMLSQRNHQYLQGDLFVFLSKSRSRVKILWFDGTGLVLLSKILEQGKFAALWGRQEITTSELGVFLDGCVVLAQESIVRENYFKS